MAILKKHDQHILLDSLQPHPSKLSSPLSGRIIKGIEPFLDQPVAKKASDALGVIRGQVPKSTVVIRKIKDVQKFVAADPVVNEELPAPPPIEPSIPSPQLPPQPLPVIPSPIPAPIPSPTIDPLVIQKEIDAIKTKTQSEIDLYKNQQMQKIDADGQAYKKQLFAKIEEEKQALLDRSYQEGVEIGRKDGEKELANQSAEILKTVNDAIMEKNKLLKKARGEILRLAIKVAEQILKSEISLNQAVCVNIVSEAISRITDKDRVIIRVNRADADFVKMNRDRFLNQMGDIKNLSVQEDSRIEQGGCIIETDLGYIDAKIETKLESIEKALYKVFDEEQLEDVRSETTP